MRRSAGSATRLAASVALVLALGACGRGKPQPPPPGEAVGQVRPTVTVVNADAYVIDGKHVRLARAFAPEPVPHARCWAEALAAKQAARVVQAMFDRAARIDVQPTGGADEYARAYAKVRLDGADLGEILFHEGLVARPPKGRFEWCNPLSRDDAGAPDLWSVMELSPRSGQAQ